MRARFVGLAVTGVLAIAACSAAPGAVSPGAAVVPPSVAAATSAPTPTPTVEPSPTPDIAAMGSAYLAFSDWLRETSFALEKKFAAAKTEAKYKALWAEAAAIYTEGAQRLATVQLPQSLEADRTKIIAALGVAAIEAGKLSANPNYDPGTKLSDAQAAVSAAGANIRQVLGLPPPPTPKP
jgi:hypothetical protein